MKIKIRLLLVDHKFHPIGRHFSVNLESSDDDDISDLKEKVKEEKEATFSKYPMFDLDNLTVWQTGGELVLNRSTANRQEAILEKIRNNVNDENIVLLNEGVLVATLRLPDGQVLLARLPGVSRIPLTYCFISCVE